MTTIAAALATGGAIVMAADTTSWFDTTPHPGAVKVWAHPVKAAESDPAHGRSVLVSVAGASALKGLLRRHWTISGVPSDDATDDEADEWASACAEAIALVALDASPPVTGHDGGVDAYTLLGYGGRLWSICQQCATPIYRGATFTALGTGGPVALGALDAMIGESGLCPARSVANVLHAAVAAACRWDAWSQVDGDGPTVLTLSRDGQLL